MKIQNVRLLISTAAPPKAEGAASISAAKYFAEVRKTLDLLKAETIDATAVNIQRAVEAEAFERYLAAMKAGLTSPGERPHVNHRQNQHKAASLPQKRQPARRLQLSLGLRRKSEPAGAPQFAA